MSGTRVPTVRRFDPADTAELVALFRAAVLAIDRSKYSTPQLTAWAQRSDATELRNRCGSAETWVAEVDERLAGFIACEDDGHVDLAFVHPRHQGCGIARAPYAEVESEARRRRLGRLFTEASHAARPFFERVGYRVLHSNQVRVRDEVLENWSMDKRLFPFRKANRIFVLGNSGSGKTTFSRALAEQLGRPHLELDVVAFADVEGTRRPVDESIERVTAVPGFTASPILEGCRADLVELFAAECDHLVWLDLPVADCIANARARPWEPHEWPSRNARDGFLPRLVAFIEGYPEDAGPTGRPAHAKLFRHFAGVREVHRTRAHVEVG